MIGAVVGLLTLLSALTMGLLIWTLTASMPARTPRSKPFPPRLCNLISRWPTLAGRNPQRAHLRQAVGRAIDDVWAARESDQNFVAQNFAAAVRGLRKEEGDLANLHPSTDAQKQALAQANTISRRSGRASADVLRVEQSGFLSAHIDRGGMGHGSLCGFGLMSRGHTMSVVAVFIGAIAVSTSVYMIPDLSSPYSGIFRPFSAPLEQVLQVMGKE